MAEIISLEPPTHHLTEEDLAFTRHCLRRIGRLDIGACTWGRPTFTSYWSTPIMILIQLSFGHNWRFWIQGRFLTEKAGCQPCFFEPRPALKTFDRDVTACSRNGLRTLVTLTLPNISDERCLWFSLDFLRSFSVYLYLRVSFFGFNVFFLTG